MKTEVVAATKKRIADIGYGYLKFLQDNGIVSKERAVVAKLGESLTDVNIKNILTVDNEDYIIGNEVYGVSDRKPITANESVKRYENIAYKVLGLYSVAKNHGSNEDKITLITGLPYQNMDEAEQVKKLFQGVHKVKLNGVEMTLNIDRVGVVSQGLGSYYTLLSQRGNIVKSRKMLLVDLGFHTINYMPIDQGGISTNSVKTNRDLGIQAAYLKIVDEVNKEFKTSYKFHDVDRLLDDGVPVQDIDKGKQLIKINDRPYVHEALREYASEVWNDIFDKYNESYREDLEEIVFSGGTAQRVEHFLTETKRSFCTFMENPQDAQALGYFEIAKRIKE